MKQLIAVLLLATSAFAQTTQINGSRTLVGASSLRFQRPNAGVTGTTVHQLAKIDSSGNAVIAGTTDTQIPVYIVAAGAGTTGNADLVSSGRATCDFDATTVVQGHFVKASGATGGKCTDAGATLPGTACIVGIANEGGAGSNTYEVTVNPFCTPSGGGDASTNTGTSVDSEIALFSGTGGKTIKRATGSGLVKAASGVYSTVTAPSGAVVGTSDSQTLTNKTLDNTDALTVKDTNLTIQDDGDTTKQAVFQASGITTAATRTYTLPDANTTFVGTGVTQTLTNKTLDNTSTVTLKDDHFTLQATGDTTKQMLLDLSAITTGNTRTVTMPDASGTMTLRGNAVTGSGSVVLATSPTLTTPSFSSIVNTGTLTLPTSTDTMVGRATTDTLTNKTYNVESTGNVFTQPSPIYLAAAGCNNATAATFWDLPTATPAAAACVTGTNIQKGVLDYLDTSGGFSAQYTLALPVDWTTATLPDVDLYWTTSATSGNAKWTVQFVCTDVAATATDDPAFPASSNGFNTVTTAAAGTANRVQTSTITGATVPASCASATKELLHIRVFRDGNDAADTIAATARFIGMMLTPRRAE
jgi:hypothetical protein